MAAFAKHWDDLMNAAIEEKIVTEIAQLEVEWDATKLSERLRSYFVKASKAMQYRKEGLKELVDQFTAAAMGSIFAGLGDREWFHTGQVDLVPVFDAAIKSFFPLWTLESADQLDFEAMVLSAHDRCFEEERFSIILSEAVPQVVSGPKIKKKVWGAVEAGRKDASDSGTEDCEDFMRNWITSAIAHLAESSNGHPEFVLKPDSAVKLFVLLTEGGGIPLALQGKGEPLKVVEAAVAAGFGDKVMNGEAEAGDEAAEDAEPAAKKPRAAGFAV